MKKLAILFVLLFCARVDAAFVFFGDTTDAPPANTQIARSCQYARLQGTMGGTGTVTMDSIVLKSRNGQTITTTNYAVIGLYLDSALTKPANRYSIDTITLTDSSITTWYRYSKVPHATISATAGVTYWIGVSCGAASSHTFFVIGLNTASIGAIQSCNGVLTNPWAGGTPGTGSYFTVGFFGHDGSVPGGGGSTTDKVIGGGLLGEGLH
jgi:hypothetical protein